MTDKEVIIDGVNVAGCENYKPKNRFTCHPHICNCHERKNCYYKQLQREKIGYQALLEIHNSHNAEYNEQLDVLQEQLQRKEQENKDLTYQYINAKDDAENYKKSAEERLELLNALNDDYKRLQAENEELKKENEKLVQRQEISGEIIDEIVKTIYPNASEDELFCIHFNGEYIEDLKEKMTKLNRYKQALKRIKEAVTEINGIIVGESDNAKQAFKEWKDMYMRKVEQILTIINEALND